MTTEGFWFLRGFRHAALDFADLNPFEHEYLPELYPGGGAELLYTTRRSRGLGRRV